MHIEGALEPELLFSLASRNGVSLPVDTSPAFTSPASLVERYKSFTSLDDFLHYYYIAMSVLQTSADFEALGMDYFRRAASQGVKHAEIFFDPQAHTSRGVGYATIVDGLQNAIARAKPELGISSLLIACVLRHLPVPDAVTHYEKYLEPDLASGKIAAMGLCSSEKGYLPKLFQPVFEPAVAKGYRRTAHAGEEGGPEYVRGALELLKVQRIDHGRTIPEDVSLLEEIAEKKILVTLCPLSNVCLKGVRSVDELPIRTFLDAGLRFSINSDDPAYFGGYILENYCAVQEAFTLNKEDWAKIVEGSIEGSWCDDVRKEELRTMLKDVIA
jgi:adenosine deaminase